ncbi:hypothetical protein MTO96_007051 [Rhipicephalus appendiculatus]
MSKRDFCSLILPQRVRRRLQEAGVENDDDLAAAGPSFAAETTLVLERRRETPVFTFNTALDCLKRSENTQRIATWIPSIDAMLDGGIPRRKIIEVTGAAGAGKTQFCMQVAASNELSKKSTVYVDSKGGFTIARYREIFAGTSRRQECSGATVW